MKKLLAGCISVVLLMLSSVSAWELGEGLYVSGSVGGVKTSEIPALIRTGGAESYLFHTGHHLKLGVGQRFKNFRLELEPSIHYFKHKNANQGDAEINMGNVKSVNILGNLFYDFATEYDVNPYIGGGVGFATLKVDGKSHPTYSNTRLAYQAMAGLSLCLDENWSSHVEYRQAWADKLNNLVSRDLSKMVQPIKNFRHKSIHVGLTHRF